jgi:hypothetical protein
MTTSASGDTQIGRCDDCGGWMWLAKARTDGHPGICVQCAYLRELRELR